MNFYYPLSTLDKCCTIFKSRILLPKQLIFVTIQIVLNCKAHTFCLPRSIIFELINKKPIVPSKNEIINNQPSRSAKLRCAKKTKDTDNFEEFIKKFEYLINIENLSKEI